MLRVTGPRQTRFAVGDVIAVYGVTPSPEILSNQKSVLICCETGLNVVVKLTAVAFQLI